MFTSVFEFLPAEIRGFAPYVAAILAAGILLGLGTLIARLRSKKAAPLVEVFEAVRDTVKAAPKTSRFKTKNGGFAELRFGGLEKLPDSSTLASILSTLPQPKSKEGSYLIDYDDLSENELTIVWQTKAPLMAATTLASERFYGRFEAVMGEPRYDRLEVLDGLDPQGNANSIALTLQKPLTPQEISSLTDALSEEFGDSWTSEIVSSTVLRFMRTDDNAAGSSEKEMTDIVLDGGDDGNGDLGNMGGLLAEDKDSELIANTDAELEEWLSYDDEDDVVQSEEYRGVPLLEDEHNPFRAAIEAAEKKKQASAVLVDEPAHVGILKEAIKLASSRTGVPGSTDDFEVVTLDEASTPREIVVYLDEAYKITDPELASFVRDMIAILNVNFEGAWDYQIFEETGIDQILFQS